MPKVENGLLIQRLLDLLKIRGPTPDFEVVEAIMPVSVVEEAGEVRQAVGYNTIAGAAGQNSHVQLWNPANSGIECHATGVFVDSASAVDFLFANHDTALTNGGAGVFRDRHYAGIPACTVRTQNAAAPIPATTTALRFPSVLGAAELIPLDWIIRPGQGLLFYSASQNVAISGNFYWEEVPI